MTRDEALSAACPGPFPLRRRFYRALAEGLLAAERGGLVLFESTYAAPIPRVTARPASLLAPMLATSTFAATPVEPGPVGDSDCPLAGATDVYATLIPERTPSMGALSDGTLAPRTRTPARRGRLGRLPDVLVGRGERSGLGDATVPFRWPFAEVGGLAIPRGGGDRRAGMEPRHRPTRGRAPSTAGRCERLASCQRRARSPVRRGWPYRRSKRKEPRSRLRSRRRSGRRVGPATGSCSVPRGPAKTWFLAERAARAIARRESVVAIDLHGDLAPAIVERLPPDLRERLVAIDATDRPVPGVAALAGSDDRAAAHLVAAIKRLTPDGTDMYWGFRLERIFDTFVRLVQESGGSLLDLYALLADADRRDAARLASRRVDLVRFLEELAPIVRRNPDFLWPAAARLSKMVLVPALAELLCPPDGGLPVEALLEGGRSILGTSAVRGAGAGGDVVRRHARSRAGVPRARLPSRATRGGPTGPRRP